MYSKKKKVVMINNDKMTTAEIFRGVVYCLIPGIIPILYFFGFGIILQILLAIITALVTEAVMLKLRNKQILYYLKDGSAVLTSILLALCIPTIAPWWIIVVGTIFAIVFSKHLYGGLGHNIFNPAMVGYVFLLLSFPEQLTKWQDIYFANIDSAFNIIFNINSIDAISQPTILDSIRNSDIYGNENFFRQQILTLDNPYMWVNLGFLVGGLYLLFLKIISWHIPVVLLLSLFILSLLLFLFDDIKFYLPIVHLFSGATMLGAFFIATDPVTASTTLFGRLIYGIFIGFLIIIIRSFSGYPDGVAFAILLANIIVPMLDANTKIKVFGR